MSCATYALAAHQAWARVDVALAGAATTSHLSIRCLCTYRRLGHVEKGHAATSSPHSRSHTRVDDKDEQHPEGDYAAGLQRRTTPNTPANNPHAAIPKFRWA